LILAVRRRSAAPIEIVGLKEEGKSKKQKIREKSSV